MANYVPVSWAAGSAGGTPVSHANLNVMEDRLELIDQMYQMMGGTAATYAGTIGASNTFLRSGGTSPTWRSAANVKTDLGLVVGTDVQAYDALLAAIAALATSADQYIYTTGVDLVALGTITSLARNLLDDASASAMRSTLGLGSIATQAASAVSITGGAISGITDLAVADGGTGASNATDARTNLGLGTVAVESTVPTAKGGTGLTTIGTGLQYLRTNAGATGLEYATMPSVPAQRTMIGPWFRSGVAGGTGTTNMSISNSGGNTESCQFHTIRSGHVVGVSMIAFDFAANDAITAGSIAAKIKTRNNPQDAWTDLFTTGALIAAGSQNAHAESFTPGAGNAIGADKNVTVDIVATGVTLAGSDLDIMVWLEWEWD